MNKVKLPISGGLIHLPLIGSFVIAAQRQRPAGSSDARGTVVKAAPFKCGFNRISDCLLIIS
ncbi:MAG TPA: hypothetical protein DDY89_19910 [Lysinibacillus sp.]|nr:hypothetical protein [Lysinibacillus sp.]